MSLLVVLIVVGWKIGARGGTPPDRVGVVRGEGGADRRAKASARPYWSLTGQSLPTISRVGPNTSSTVSMTPRRIHSSTVGSDGIPEILHSTDGRAARSMISDVHRSQSDVVLCVGGLPR